MGCLGACRAVRDSAYKSSRHRRDACSTAWRCGSRAARFAPRRASDSLVDLRTGMPGGMPDMSGMGGMGGAPAEEPADEGPKIEEID